MTCIGFGLAFPVFVQKCKVIYKMDSKTHARYITLGHTITVGTLCPTLCDNCLGSISSHRGCRH